MRRLRTCCVFALFFVVLYLTAFRGTRVAAQVDDQSTGLWFVELDGSAAAFRGNAANAGITYTERFAYRRLWNGVSIQTSANASQLALVRGVRAVYPVLHAAVGPMEAAVPELVHALVMTGAAAAQDDLDLTGAGVKVAVIDSGIDYHHPDLGGAFGAGSRVVTGFDFVGDRYNSSGSGGALIPHPDADPDDCLGHGTHVAGIIGANGDPAAGGARGVAPDVTFGAYRVFGCDGTTTADIMLAAMERALADGMDVLNMSIGASFQTWPQYPTAVGADRLVAEGMVVVASIGNSGASGIASAGAPGVGRNVIGVASFDNSHVVQPKFLVSPDEMPVGYVLATTAPAAPTTGTAVLARTGLPTSTNDACSVLQPDGTLASPLAPGSLEGRVALIRRGTCSFYEKSINAQNAGADAVVLYNNAAGLLNATVAPPAGSPNVAIPVVGIPAAEGATISNRIAAGPTTLTWSDETSSFVNPTGGIASSFSSWGLNAELAVKPNIGAPGGLIRSTFPLELGGYVTISGTSMASPHVAGAVALFLEAHPGATPAAVKTALQNSADARLFTPTLPFFDAVHRQGAGMLDIDDAILATTAITPSEIPLGEGPEPRTVRLTVKNNGSAPVVYSFAHQTGVSTSGIFAPSAFTSAATVALPAGAEVPAGGSQEFVFTITPSTTTLNAHRIYGGWIVVNGGGKSYTVPYAGYRGDYQEIVVLSPGGCGLSPFPGIFKLGGQTACNTATPPATLDIPVTRQAEGATFMIEDRNDRPIILYQRQHQSRRLEIRALEQATGTSHLVAFADYVGRNANNLPSLVNGGFSTFTWDGKVLFTNGAGKTQRRAAPAGAYNLQLVVTKALADPANPAHTEVWTSPTINIVQ
jgi:subtilisin family serine protease